MRRPAHYETGLCVLLLAFVGLFCFERARQLRYDFHHFYRDAHYVWQNGALNPVLHAENKLTERQLPFYLPIVPLAIAPLTFAGLAPAAALWALMQVVTLAYSLFELRRRWAASATVFWLATALVLPALYEAAFFNQLSFPILALCLVTIRFVENNRFAAAAASLAVACVSKFLPGTLLLWVFLQRRLAAALRFAGLTMAFSIALTLLPCWAAFGWDNTNRYLIEWWRYNLDSARSLDLLDADIDAHFLGHTNQSVRAVIARWTWPQHPYRMPNQPISFDKPAVVRVSAVVSAALLCLWIALTFRAGRNEPAASAQRAAAAVWMIGMLVFSPLLRQYYLIWAWPAVVFLADAAWGGAAARNKAPLPRARLCAVFGLAAWIIGMLLWPVPIARLGGVHLLMLILVAACTALAGRWATAAKSPARANPA